VKKGGNPQNLKPFVKGEDPRRNMNGAPKLPELELLIAEGVSQSDLLLIVKTMAERAMKGDTRAADFIFDRGYGKAKQSTELKLNSDQPLFLFKKANT
jgi:hypothetical protein